MPLLSDRVQETSTTTGTGTLTLAGAVTGYRSFNASFTNGDAVFYTIDDTLGNWEVGSGTVGTGTLTRATVIVSSNANALVNFGAGAKRVFCSAPTRALLPNQTGNSGKYLTTDGTSPSWSTVTAGTVTSVSGTGTVSGITLTGTVTTSGSLTLGGTLDLSSPPAIGGTTPAAGNFTTLGATGNVTLGDAAGDTLTINAGTTTFTQGTANGVLYLNGSKVATSGSGLVFDGTKFTQTASTTGILSEFVNPSSANQNGNIVATNDAGTRVRLQVFGSAAGSYGMLSANSSVLYTSGTDLNLVADNASGVIKFGLNGSSEQMRLTSKGLLVGYTSDSGLSGTGNAIFSGNLGLGVTPSAYQSGAKAFQNPAGSLYTINNLQQRLSFNAYRASDGNEKYLANGFATEYRQGEGSGTHSWYTAPSGTAGDAISFTQAMTLDVGGNLLVGATSPSTLGANTKLKVQSNSGFGGASIGHLNATGVGPHDTGISINQGNAGGTIIFLASNNDSAGTATQSSVYIIRFYYDGNNAPTKTYLGGSGDVFTFGVSGSNTLTVTQPAYSGNKSFAWFGTK